MRLRDKIRRRKQRKAIEAAIKQAQEIQADYTNAGMTPEQVNQINSMVPNIGGATKQQIAAATTSSTGGYTAGGDGGGGGGGYAPQQQDQAGGGGYAPQQQDPGGFDGGYGSAAPDVFGDNQSFEEFIVSPAFKRLEQFELMKLDPIYAMVRYNKMVGNGSNGGKNYSEKFEQKEYFEDADADGIGSVLGGSIDNIMSLFQKNWEDNRPASFTEAFGHRQNGYGCHCNHPSKLEFHGKNHVENFLGLNKFFGKLAGKEKSEDKHRQWCIDRGFKPSESNDMENAESLEIGATIMEFLPVIILAYVGYHFYGYTGAIVAGLAAYFLFHKKQEEPETHPGSGPGHGHKHK